MPDIGEAAMHHDLHAVGPAALVGVTDDAHVARVVRLRQLGHLKIRSFPRKREPSSLATPSAVLGPRFRGDERK